MSPLAERHRRSPKKWKEPVDRVPSDDITDAEVQRLILAEIDQHVRRLKWQLRSALCINDARLLKMLTVLRKAGIVYCSGPTSAKQWQRS